jgi:trehalose 6-phosphate phosphatase
MPLIGLQMSFDISDIHTLAAAKPDMEPSATPPIPNLRKCAILLDIDGTILDFAPSPQQVAVPAELRQTLTLLDRLTGGALALVSGRPLTDVDLIFAPLKLAAIGGHGAELRAKAGDKIIMRAKPLDAVLKARLARVSDIGPGILVEDKDYSLALHYRLAPEKGDAVRAAIETICAKIDPGTVEILPGKLVVEIKPAGINKAEAVRELMGLAPFAKRSPIFIGDDITDEPVFGVVPQFGGLGFSVGRIAPAVNGHFADPQSVRAWLARIAADDEGKPG